MRTGARAAPEAQAKGPELAATTAHAVEHTDSRARVVVLGGGYGGVYAALGLSRAARRGEIHLSLVSRENFFLFQPMLAEVVSGSIEPPHIVSPLRRLLPHADIHQAEIEAIDNESHMVILRYPGTTDFRTIPYDHLLIALGSGSDLSAVPGLAEHAFPFRTLGDAFYLRNHVIGLLEQAEIEEDATRKQSLLTFVVAGGGYTGVEVAAELNSFVREAAKSYRHVAPEQARVLLLQGADRILPELPAGLAQFGHKVLERRGVEVRLRCRIAGATAESAILDSGEIIAAHTVVAAVGAAPNRVLDTLQGERDRKRRVVVDETLAVRGLINVWALGDCAAVPDLAGGGLCPPTAQFALRQARHVAKNIRNSIKGGRPRPFHYRAKGVFVPLGRYSGAAQVFGRNLSGLLAWWLYRSYYLYQLPRLDRKIRVLLDWNLELFFHRDIVKQDVRQSDPVLRAHYEPGQAIFRQGELARSFYIIVTGTVRIERHTQEGQERVAVLGTGEYFGEMALLQGRWHTASALAETPVDVITLSGTAFTALATSSTRFGELLANVARQRRGSETTARG